MVGRAPHAANPHQAGFTLFEMLVVLALLALSAYLVLPAIGGGDDRLALRSTALQVAALARSTRLKAMADGEDALLIVNLDDRTVARPGAGRPISVPPRTEIAVETARSELADPEARIRFLPDGRSTGGTVTLSAGGHQVVVAVDWLTGSVAVREAGQ
jgi:general secretion pathway protein H